jgi:hypothetical protein
MMVSKLHSYKLTCIISIPAVMLQYLLSSLQGPHSITSECNVLIYMSMFYRPLVPTKPQSRVLPLLSSSVPINGSEKVPEDNNHSKKHHSNVLEECLGNMLAEPVEHGGLGRNRQNVLV